VPLEQDPNAMPREDPADLGLAELVTGPRDEDVGDREARVKRQRRVEACGTERVGPELTRDVGQDAGPVALTVDLTRAVREALEPADRFRDDLFGRQAVLARDRDQRAGVAFVHG